ncbi:MAG: resolvase [Eubacterium sp.]|nr:resolvase [Eubacterium sp.]
MARKKEKRINVIAYLSTDGNMYSAPVKEKKQYRYIEEYAKAHNIHISKVVHRDIASNMDVIKHFRKLARTVETDIDIDGVIVANTAAVSASVSDAYYKVGLIVEAGGVFISVDEGRLSLRKEA